MEYKIIKVNVSGMLGTSIASKAEKMLNEMSDDGWKLVAVVPIVGVRMTFISSTIGYFYHFGK